MSTYVISDVHGCNEKFRAALKSIKLKKTDTLILLGDLIDRGHDSKGVLDTVLLLLEHDFNVICLKGNHEQMLLDSFIDVSAKVNWLKNGGTETLSSFITSNIENIPIRYIEFIKTFKNYLEIGNLFLVHAGLNLDMENPLEDLHSMLWMRNQEDFINHPWLKNKILIHGHNPTRKVEILKQFENQLPIRCIDNGCFMERNGYGEICVLRIEDLKIHFC
jgi:serine/threonine protein phosphatase 1